MSFLSDKFNIPQETVKSMMRSGVISCSWEGYDEVIELHRNGKSMREIAVITNRSTTRVYQIISVYKKM
jgi:hypothetical protein